MNMATGPLATHTAVPVEHDSESEPELTHRDTLEAIAEAIEARGAQQLAGVEGVEDRKFLEIYNHPTQYHHSYEAYVVSEQTDTLRGEHVDGSIFGALAEEIKAMGLGDFATIGEVVVALGADPENEDDVRSWIDYLGCWCNGQIISTAELADRLRSLIR